MDKQSCNKLLIDLMAMVQNIPSVERVSMKKDGDYLRLVVHSNNSTREERFQVYEAQQAIYDQNPSVKFDFGLEDRRGYSTQEQQ